MLGSWHMHPSPAVARTSIVTVAQADFDGSRVPVESYPIQASSAPPRHAGLARPGKGSGRRDRKMPAP